MGEKKATAISRADFEKLISPVIGLPVNWPWRGYGSAIFLELGNLHRIRRRRGNGHHILGEVTIMIEWDWRVEDSSSILFASNSKDEQFDPGLKSLQRRIITSIELVGRVPELAILFDDDRSLRTFVTVPPQPRWAIKLFQGPWLSVDETTGELTVEED